MSSPPPRNASASHLTAQGHMTSMSAKPTLVISAVVTVLVALGLALGVGDPSASSDYSSDHSSGGSTPWSSYEVFSILSGIVLLAAVFVPTMPRRRQALLGVCGVVLAAYGLWVHVQVSGVFLFPAEVFVVPFMASGWAAWGWYQNVRRGEGARGPTDGGGETGPDLVFPVAVRARSRARIGLDLEVEAEPRDIVEAVRRALSDRGNYFLTDGCGYSVLAQRPDGLDCAVVTPWRGHRNCTFAVRLVPGTPHRLTVQILEQRVVQERVAFVIPVGPATLPGEQSYRHFLRSLVREVRAEDPDCLACVVQTPS